MIEGTCVLKKRNPVSGINGGRDLASHAKVPHLFSSEDRTYSVPGGLVKVSFVPYLDRASCGERHFEVTLKSKLPPASEISMISLLSLLYLAAT